MYLSIIHLKILFFNDSLNDRYKNKWEFFKYKVRNVAINRRKDVKKEKHRLEADLMHKLNLLLLKEQLTSEEEI